MSGNIQAVRGMHDTLPDSTPLWQFLEGTIKNVLDGYGFQEIRFPIVEKTELFERSIGAATDIVSKEMYTFPDRNGESLTLRPEGTASCVRAGLEHGLFNQGVQRLWYMGPMFRYEKPQKGRLRQFHQVGVEATGLPGPDIDAELIILCARLWKALGLPRLQLELNTLGTTASRHAYRELLVQYFSDNLNKLDEDSRKRLGVNPLRILDSKNPDLQPLLAQAPLLEQHLDAESAQHFAALKALLDTAGINYRINPRLVRGLDYYGKTVFEWTTERLGAQGTVCAGGRYDGLVEHFGGKPVPAVGFAMGLERLLSLLNDAGTVKPDNCPQVYFIVAGDKAIAGAIKLAETLRDQLPGLRLLMNCGGGSFKSQFKKADKSGAILALILGDAELDKQVAGIKPLRDETEQIEAGWPELAGILRQRLRL